MDAEWVGVIVAAAALVIATGTPNFPLVGLSTIFETGA